MLFICLGKQTLHSYFQGCAVCQTAPSSTLSMETWAGGILWKPPLQMHRQASPHQPDELDPHLPWQAAKAMQVGSLPLPWSLCQAPASCPSALRLTSPKLITLVLWLCPLRGLKPGETRTSDCPAGTGG